MLQVRNLPDDVHAKLKRRAAGAGMSLSEYVGRELARLVETRSVDEVLLWAENRKTGLTRDQFDSVADELRAERDARPSW